MATPHVFPPEAHCATRVRMLRGSLSLREMARLVDCSASYLCELEAGAKIPSDEFLERVRLALGTGNLRGPDRPRKEGRPSLPALAAKIRGAFKCPPPLRPVQPLRQAFSLARYNPSGRELVEELDTRRRPGIFWKAVKWSAGQMNGPEQGVFLRLLVPTGEMHELHPRQVGFPLPVIEPPGHWWVAAVTVVGGRLLVAFPQLGVHTANGVPRRLDFLLGLEGSGLVNLEVDGPIHRGRKTYDRIRAEELGLRTLRVTTQMWHQDFLGALVKKIQA